LKKTLNNLYKSIIIEKLDNITNIYSNIYQMCVEIMPRKFDRKYLEKYNRNDKKITIVFL